MSKRALLQGLLGLAVSALFAWLALRNVSLHAVGQALRHANYWWIIPAVLILLVGVWMRAERWRYLFSPQERPPIVPTFWALNVGQLFNNVLPARAGEVARVLALSHETGMSRTYGFVTVVVERVFDLVAIAILALLAWSMFPHDRLTTNLAYVSLAILAAVVVLVALMAVAPLRRKAERLLPRVPVLGGARSERTARALRLGMGPLRDVSLAAPVALWTVGSWVVLSASNWCVLQAFPVHIPWPAALLSILTTNLAMVVPSSPGALGVYELAAQSALTTYGVGSSVALSFALVVHAVNLVPYLILGTIGLTRLGMRSSEVLHPEAEGA